MRGLHHGLLALALVGAGPALAAPPQGSPSAKPTRDRPAAAGASTGKLAKGFAAARRKCPKTLHCRVGAARVGLKLQATYRDGPQRRLACDYAAKPVRRANLLGGCPGKPFKARSCTNLPKRLTVKGVQVDGAMVKTKKKKSPYNAKCRLDMRMKLVGR